MVQRAEDAVVLTFFSYLYSVALFFLKLARPKVSSGC